eukprot:11219180-Lingulodinium_polyedra.AAC.1
MQLVASISIADTTPCTSMHSSCTPLVAQALLTPLVASVLSHFASSKPVLLVPPCSRKMAIPHVQCGMRNFLAPDGAGHFIVHGISGEVVKTTAEVELQFSDQGWCAIQPASGDSVWLEKHLTVIVAQTPEKKVFMQDKKGTSMWHEKAQLSYQHKYNSINIYGKKVQLKLYKCQAPWSGSMVFMQLRELQAINAKVLSLCFPHNEVHETSLLLLAA